MNMYSRVSKHQENIISTLETRIDQMNDAIAEKKALIAKKRPKAEFYKNMVETILSDPDLYEEWGAFIILVKLTVDSPVKGITC